MEHPPDQNQHPVSQMVARLHRDLIDAGRKMEIPQKMQREIVAYTERIKEKYEPKVLRENAAFQALIGSPPLYAVRNYKKDFTEEKDSVEKFLKELRKKLFPPTKRN